MLVASWKLSRNKRITKAIILSRRPRRWMTLVTAENNCDPLQCLCRGDHPRLLQLAVGPGSAAAGGGDWTHDLVVTPAGHRLQTSTWGGSTWAAEGRHRARHQAHHTGKAITYIYHIQMVAIVLWRHTQLKCREHVVLPCSRLQVVQLYGIWKLWSFHHFWLINNRKDEI